MRIPAGLYEGFYMSITTVALPRSGWAPRKAESRPLEVERASYSYSTITSQSNFLTGALAALHRARGVRPPEMPPRVVSPSIRYFLSDLERLNHEVDRNPGDIEPFRTAFHEFFRG